MRENFVKIVEDRLILLNAYRTLHLTIPEASPLSGELFLDLLKVTRYIESKTIDTPARRVLTRSQEILDESVIGNFSLILFKTIIMYVYVYHHLTYVFL